MYVVDVSVDVADSAFESNTVGSATSYSVETDSLPSFGGSPRQQVAISRLVVPR